MDCKSSLLTVLSLKVGTRTVMVSDNLLSATSEVLILLFGGVIVLEFTDLCVLRTVFIS